MPRIFFLILFLFQLDASFGQDRSLYTQRCLSAIPDIPVTLLVKPSAPVFDLEKTSNEITLISEKWGNPSDKNKNKKFHSHGYTATEIVVSVESDARGLYLIPSKRPTKDSDPAKLMCFKAGFNVKLSFDFFVIYLPKNFLKNKCIHDGVRRHEMQHANLYMENIKLLGDEIKAYAQNKTQGKIFFVENSQSFDVGSLAQDINDFGMKRWAEMQKSHISIDYFDDFNDLKRDCGA